jgi:murein L,D-transpeptidase YafK
MRRAMAIGGVLVAAALLLTGCPKKLPPAPPAPPAEQPAPAPSGACKRVERIEVRKHARELRAACTGGAELVFPIALSRERGPKRMRGDQRMPEGEYRVAGPARKSRFHLFLPLDYPSRADADRALREGRIDRGVHAAIVAAHEKGALPPQDTPLGGALGIHGEGVRWRGDLDLNWTEGCVAVTDQAIAQLARLVRRGTPVRIVP